ncbi:MAG: type II and III secretion system protein family protein [Betaproteobacteria bacterium]
MTRIRSVLFGFILLTLGLPACASKEHLLELEVGSSHVLRHKSVQRLAVGNGQVVQASALSPTEAIVFGKRSGTTTINIWVSKTTHITYRVHVRPEGYGQAMKEVKAILASIPGARTTVAAGRVLLEGDDLTEAERSTLARLAARFPDLIEFANQSEWERMVMLDVQVIEIPSARMHELGVRWDTNTSLGMQSSRLALTALVSARLAALSKTGEAVVLAQPQLLARSGSTASFSAGGEVPYTTQDKDGRAHTTFKKYGVHLNITPQIGRNLAVRSKIEIEVSTVDQTLASSAGPALKVRRASTDFNVRSGQTLVLGGFISREQSGDTEGLPGISEIPAIGQLFGVKRVHRSQTELAIFVTPIVVDAGHSDLVQRTSNARSLLSESFPDAPRLNSPISGGQDLDKKIIFDGQWDTNVLNSHETNVVNQWE